MTETLDDARIQAIVQRVLREMGQAAPAERPAGPPSPSSRDDQKGRAATPAPAVAGHDGIFPTIDAAVAAARAAFVALGRMTLARRYDIIAAVRSSMKANAELLARMAHEETGLGRPEDKLQKNLLVVEKTPGPEILQPLTWTGDGGLTLVERAPYGVIAAITPVTNPTSTIINNSISILAAGNAVVFNVHPSARHVCSRQIQLVNQAITAAGGPANLVAACAEPTIETAQELMRHPGVRLLLVTGGPAVVREAMRSGKRAVCAGPGNPPVVVDETADIDKAGRDITFGGGFDNNVICTDEKEIFVVESVADQLKAAMCAHGALEVPSYKLRQLERVIFSEMGAPRKPGVTNKQWVGKYAGDILREIGIAAGKEVRLALVEVPLEHPLVWTEQLMPVMPLVRVRNCDQAIDLAVEAEHGFGHTASMWSRNIDMLSRMAREIDCSIFVKNGPTLAGLGYHGEGFTSFSIASPTGEGLTSALTFSRIRRCTLVDHFRIV